ncbi:hypothetical protein [Pseudoruegeria sp. SHC-113]|uniref:hypothetical protein n=1 Tax=Pseudoruegeria sp. SHC-113 TaxID=2855439 RepID=UPI0021BABA2B|nr:hypothetical protein [Pseudoruegeria sp. SHC-113]MCT8160649.1 hypothetical protein [Pseudoruegeria sp. SHC-113]
MAKITGADLKDPQRYRERHEPDTGPLGEPPAKFTKAQRDAWLELADELPWLTKSDRHILAIAARLQAAIIEDPAAPIGAFNQLRLCLASMGGTPADRSKVSTPREDEPDPASEFLN